MMELRRVARNVSDLAAASAFYSMLGFEAVGPATENAELALILEVERVVSLRLALGAQQLELTKCEPEGAVYPIAAKANDICFQHIAIVTRDIFAMHERALRAGAVAISFQGPQQLPAESGGAIAWKFRDPDGHPVEFLQMAERSAWNGKALTSGYDHSAICVRDAARSIRFYQSLGFALGHRHVNQGAAQARLDGLEVSTVEVVAMVPAHAPPHVELLAYQGDAMAGRAMRPNDIAADRMVFATPGARAVLQMDPDGHFLLLDGHN